MSQLLLKSLGIRVEQPECTECGGHDIKQDAWAEWDIDKQDWVLGTIFDHSHCEDCEGECSYNMVEVAA